MIRARFAPSPTGYLHVGGARTALFNCLLARRRGGVFVLRIEDTDVERSSADMVEAVLDGLRWLGLDWDEGPKVDGPFGPYFQSERLDRYRRVASALVASGHAYYCYCSQADLQARREAAEASEGGWQYDRKCRSLAPEQIAAYERENRPRTIRFRVPAGVMRFDDLVHGPIEFDLTHLEDFVVLRSDAHPTYHLSVVADDVDMRITHVVRGDDHISNTPKQILLYRALGAPLPQFAHVPLILGSDKKRLSKRHGATSVMEYARQGYLPEAVVNFLALLGWSPGRGDRELFSRDELVAAFNLEGISGSSAVFNLEKLEWFNQQHMFRLAPDELARRVKPWLEAAGLWDDAYLGEKQAWFLGVLDLLKPRAKKLDEFASLGRFFFVDKVECEERAIARHVRIDGMRGHLEALERALTELATFDPGSTEAALRGVAAARGINPALLIHATRVALTGRSVSPGLFDVAALLGSARTRQRLAAVRELAV